MMPELEEKFKATIREALIKDFRTWAGSECLKRVELGEVRLEHNDDQKVYLLIPAHSLSGYRVAAVCDKPPMKMLEWIDTH